MLSKPFAVVLLAAACVTAAAGGAFLAVRHNGTGIPAPEASGAVLTADSGAVADTEALVETPERLPDPQPAEPDRVRPPAARAAAVPVGQPTASPRRQPRPAPVAATPEAPTTVEAPATIAEPEPPPASGPAEPVEPAEVVPAAADPPPLPPARFFEDVVVPAASVIGLQVETPVSTERARIEDRVEARVLRDVTVDGRTAIPAGARAIGAVTLVEPGGKLKERARLGVRFHTLVLADGLQLPVQTETILREGEAPSGESARKIGGAAAGGAILGAILGGKRGAVIGGATGAAGGTAMVMAGGRNPATLPAGAVVTVRLAEPLTVEVERR